MPGRGGFKTVAFSEIDRNLLARCLARKPHAWEDFVDRYMGLVIHVINHSAQARSIRLSPEDREDLCSEVFLTLVRNDFAVLRHFRGESAFAAYLTVVCRRAVVHQLLKRKSAARLADGAADSNHDSRGGLAIERVQDRDEIARLMQELDPPAADVVRMYHLEGKSYQEISSLVGMPENSIGPTLSRARQKMRRAGVDPAVG
jgi:RNA polymerase sigma-70 factor, ECF subfamily